MIDNETVNAINARELHRQLKSKQEFSHWIKDRIEKYGFEEGVDFDLIKLSNQKGRGGDRRSIDYIISLDMGKELCMVENSAQGRKIRRYFIEVAKQYPALRPETRMNRDETIYLNIANVAEEFTDTRLYKLLDRVRSCGIDVQWETAEAALLFNNLRQFMKEALDICRSLNG